MNLFKIILLAVLFVNAQFVTAAQQSQVEVEAKRKAERQISEYGREEVRKTFIREISKLESSNEWPRRKKFIRSAIEIYEFHPDEIWYRLDAGTSSPLYDAAAQSDKEFVNYLLGKNADVNCKVFFNYRLLLFGVRDVAIAKMLINKGANVNCIEVNYSENRRNLLFNEFTQKNPKLALLYCSFGIDPRIRDKCGLSALVHLLCDCPEGLARTASIFVKMGVPLDSPNGVFEDMLGARRERVSEQDQKKVLAAIQSAKQEVDKTQIDRSLGLLPLLQQCGHFHAGPAKIIHSYENPGDHILPLSLVREMEELDKELEGQNEEDKN